MGLAKFRHTTAAFKGFEVGKEVRSIVPSAEVQTALLDLLDDLSTHRPPGKDLIDGVLAQADCAGGRESCCENRRGDWNNRRHAFVNWPMPCMPKSVIRKLSQSCSLNDEQPPDLVRAALLIAVLDNDELDAAAYRSASR